MGNNDVQTCIGFKLGFVHFAFHSAWLLPSVMPLLGGKPCPTGYEGLTIRLRNKVRFGALCLDPLYRSTPFALRGGTSEEGNPTLKVHIESVHLLPV